MRERLIQAVADACTGVDGLEAAVVFGSALGRDDPDDLDLALLWRSTLAPAERFRRGNRLAAEVERRLPRPGLEVDVQDLRSLPLPLQHRVLREGTVAHRADARAFVRFVSETVPRALDFLPCYRRSLRAAAERLARGGR